MRMPRQSLRPPSQANIALCCLWLAAAGSTACSKQAPAKAASAGPSVVTPMRDQPVPPVVLPPRSLRFSMGGRVSTLITFDGTVAAYKSVGGFGPQAGEVFGQRKGVPTAEQWQTLATQLEQLGVWRWPERFQSPRSAQTDGVAWELQMVGVDGQRFSSAGYNAAPAALDDVMAGLLALIPTAP